MPETDDERKAHEAANDCIANNHSSGMSPEDKACWTEEQKQESYLTYLGIDRPDCGTALDSIRLESKGSGRRGRITSFP